jgi:tRNA (guanine37-N1)-methyltransferase
MALCLKIRQDKGEFVISKLKSEGSFDPSRKVKREAGFLYIPLTKEPSEKLGELLETELEERETKLKSLEEILQGEFSADELEELKTSYDLFGEVAVLEIPDELIPKEETIGRALLKLYPKLRAVFKKSGEVRGEFRVRELKLIAGTGSSVTTYKEHGCTYRFDIAKVFFTPRLSTERLRVAEQAKAGEVVVDMFAGVGPFSILIAKKQPKIKKIYAIDLNPDAVLYMKENIILNKAQEKIIPLVGDATKIVSKELKGVADRVIMNLPKTGEDFLPYAIQALKKKGVIHFYTFAADEESVEADLKKKLSGYKYRILETRRVKPYAPHEWTFAADIELEKA